MTPQPAENWVHELDRIVAHRRASQSAAEAILATPEMRRMQETWHRVAHWEVWCRVSMPGVEPTDEQIWDQLAQWGLHDSVIAWVMAGVQTGDKQ